MLHYCQVAVSQSVEHAYSILKKFRVAVGNIGKIYGPMKPAKNQKKVRYLYEVSGYENTKQVKNLLWPWLSKTKREKFTMVLNKYKNCRKK